MIKDYNAMKKLSDNYGIYQDEGKIYLVRNIKVYDLNDKNALKKAVDDLYSLFNNEKTEEEITKSYGVLEE